MSGPVVLNMVAGPGAGKSTTAAGVFAELKLRGCNAELVTEYAKDLVWAGHEVTLGNQVHLLGEQYNRLWRLRDKVAVIVTDSPLFLATYYGSHMSGTFKRLVIELFNEFDNLIFYLDRVKEFNPAGRVQSERKARSIDGQLLDLLDSYGYSYTRIPADRDAVRKIADVVWAIP